MSNDFTLGQRTASLYAVPNLPLVEMDNDVARLICEQMTNEGFSFRVGDVLVIAHKIVSNVEGAIVHLADVEPMDRAFELARATGRDTRLCTGAANCQFGPMARSPSSSP
jgi:coenzyme F420-0:L-glutamate ligase / coenzyme F420-1:gamma-L-glutamate ligase